MKTLAELMKEVAQAVKKETTLRQNLNELEEAAVVAEKGSMPELGRILLIHVDIMRGMLERSRRLWMQVSMTLSIALIGLIVGMLLFA